MLHASQRDALPEHTTFRDDGCSLFASCLACELPACRFDLPPKVAGAMLRYLRLRPYLDAGLTAEEAAAATGMSRRSVFRMKHFGERYAALLAVGP